MWKGHNSFSYLWKFEPNTPNGFGEILFLVLKILQRMYGSLTFLPHSNFAVFDGWYFLQYCLQRVENCANCLTESALSTFAFSSYSRPRLLWVKSYDNEEKCKQWRQQRFAYTKLPANTAAGSRDLEMTVGSLSNEECDDVSENVEKN